MGKFLDYIKDKMDLKSHRQRMDERFENGVQVAAALAPRGTHIGRLDNIFGEYAMRRNGKKVFESSPRDIIRNANQEYPYRALSLSNNGKFNHDAIRDFDRIYNNVTLHRDNLNSPSVFGTDETRRYTDAINAHKKGRKDIAQDIVKPRKRQKPYNLDDWKDFVESRKSSKDWGHRIGKIFSNKNKIEKRKYAAISGASNENLYTLRDPNGYVIEYEVPESEISTYEKRFKEKWGDGYEMDKVLTHPKSDKPKVALGGQNAQYLNDELEEEEPQSLLQLENSAKPIHYDKDGNPYVRGFTWTQTGNIPKITDPNSGYLATVGADTKKYHPHVKGQWTSEGWGNPMDKNYENGVRPGEVWKSKNFDEQLLETRWPLKFYQKAPFINQGGTQERVTVMGAGPGAKDVHRPVMVEVIAPSEMRRKIDKLNNQHFADLKDLQERMTAEGIPQGSPEWEKQIYIMDRDWLDRSAEIMGSYPEGTKMYEMVMSPVGTSVDKIATPSRMITAHMEDNMPSEWTMYDRRNGGKTIAGWHPNKKWSDMNAEKFADEVRNLNPELYKEISKAYEDEYGLGGMELAANGPKFVGRWFLENPDKLEALKQSKVSDITRVMERNNEMEPQYALIDRARAQSLMDVPVKTPYEYSSMAFDNLPSRDVFAKGSMYRGEKPYTFSRFDDETPKSVKDFYDQLEARKDVLRSNLYKEDGRIDPVVHDELVRLGRITEKIETDYGHYVW